MEVRLESISKRYSGTWALNAVSLQFSEGENIAVLGLNGAGKTTLLSILAGLAAPDKGTLFYDHDAFKRSRMDMRKRVFYTPDVPFYFEEKTVIENIAAFVQMYDRQASFDASALADLMDEIELAHLGDKEVRQLSRGQKWKLALSCAAAIQPEVWLVDEPFASGMDALGLAGFKKVVGKLTQSGKTVVYTTQLMELAVSFSSRMLLLNDGVVRLYEETSKVAGLLQQNEGKVDELFRGLRSPAT